MTEEAVTVDGLRGMLGVEGKPAVVEIEKRMVKRFVEAVGDTNSLWQEIAPPGLFFSAMISGSGARPEVPLPFTRVLDGGGEWEFFLPVKIGDIITSVTQFTHLHEREGKTGKMLFLTFETTHKNQKGEVVAKSRATGVNLE